MWTTIPHLEVQNVCSWYIMLVQGCLYVGFGRAYLVQILLEVDLSNVNIAITWTHIFEWYAGNDGLKSEHDEDTCL